MSYMQEAKNLLFSNRQNLPIYFYNHNYNLNRRNKIILLFCVFRKYGVFNKLTEDMQTLVVKRIERNCFNSACAKVDEYHEAKNWDNKNFIFVYNQITYKLQRNICTSLVEAIIAGDISLNSQQLNPSANQIYRDQIESRKKQVIKKKYSALYTCSKCKGTKTTEIEMQTRSLDEGSTLFIQCEIEGCGHSWSFSS